MIEDPLPIRLQISVFYLARELTRSMLLSSRAALKTGGFCSVLCNPSIFSPGSSIMRRRSVRLKAVIYLFFPSPECLGVIDTLD